MVAPALNHQTIGLERTGRRLFGRTAGPFQKGKLRYVSLSASHTLPSGARMANRKYTVSGVDSEGDLHSFSSDDKERACAMEAASKEDLDNVVFEDVQ